MTNIEQLLHSKKLSGEEVGRAIVSSLSNDYSRVLDPSIAPLFSQEDLEHMKDSLRTEYDIDVYNCYVNLETMLRQCQMTAQGQYQQALNGIYRLSLPLTVAHYALDLRENIDSQPSGSLDNTFKSKLETMYNNMDTLGNDSELESAISCRNILLIPASKEVYAYNALFTAIASEYNLPEVNVFKIDTYPLEEQIDMYNAVSKFLISRSADAGDERREKKAEKIFTQISCEDLQPTEPSIAKVRQLVRDLSIFSGSTRYLIDTLLGHGV